MDNNGQPALQESVSKLLDLLEKEAITIEQARDEAILIKEKLKTQNNSNKVNES